MVATEPRMPCYKLDLRFGREGVVKRFIASGRPGIYCAVLKEGEVSAGDSIEMLSRDELRVLVADIVRLYVRDRDDLEALRRAVRLEVLPEEWRERFLGQIKKCEK